MRPAGGVRVARQPGEEVRDRALGLGPARRVVRAAQPDDAWERAVVGRLGRGGPHRVDVQGVPGRAILPRDPDDGRAALVGQDPVHGIRRDRHDRRAAGRQERLRGEVEHLVRPGPDEELLDGDPVALGRGLDEPAVVGRRVLGQLDLELARWRASPGPRRVARARCSGRTGRPARRGCRSARRPTRSSPPTTTTRASSATRTSWAWGSCGRAAAGRRGDPGQCPDAPSPSFLCWATILSVRCDGSSS